MTDDIFINRKCYKMEFIRFIFFLYDLFDSFFKNEFKKNCVTRKLFDDEFDEASKSFLVDRLLELQNS